MRRRADFLAARRGERRGGPLFTIEVLDRSAAEPALRGAPPRLGMTVTRKIGNAPLRNRIRRRIREAVRTRVARDMRPGHDYVVVAKPEAATAPFEALVAALRARMTPPMGAGSGAGSGAGKGAGRGSRRGRGPRRRGARSAPGAPSPNASPTGGA